MKQYFAKYLPVGGDVKKGDKFRYRNLEEIHTACADKIDNEGLRIVKLFLCSREVQMGDKVLDIRTNTWKEVNNPCGVELYKQKPNGDQFKLIGEISPNAKYVKEGDEFDENQVRWTPIKDKEFDWKVINPVQSLPYDNATIQIKCPCCETFK